MNVLVIDMFFVSATIACGLELTARNAEEHIKEYSRVWSNRSGQ